MAIKRKIGHLIRWLLALIVIIIGGLYVMLSVETTQTWLAQRIAAYLSAELKTKVTVGGVGIKFFERLSLKNLYVEDRHHHVMLHADELLVNIRRFSLQKHILEISKATLSHAEFYLTRYAGEKSDNIKFISDYFSSGSSGSSSVKWDVKLNDVRLDEVAFIHTDENHAPKPDVVDLAHLEVNHIAGDLRNITFVNDSAFMNIHMLHFAEKSGFILDEMSADAKIAPGEMVMKNLVIRTPATAIHTDLTFRFENMDDFDDFENKVHFNSTFKKSVVSFRDLACFSRDLKGMDIAVGLDGSFKGLVNGFTGKQVTIQFGSRSFFRGNVQVTGLPDIDHTYMDILASEVTTNTHDLEKIPLPPFDEHHYIVVPQNLASLGQVTFKGKYTGMFKDFVAFGNITTDIGFISTNINMTYDKNKKRSFYSGHISTNQFNAGRILGSPDLGELTMNADVNGSGLRLDNLDARLKGTIDLLRFKNYAYRGININGEVAKKLFSGSLSIHEPNVDLAFSGTVNFTQQVPEFDFVADIGRARLDTLNLFGHRGNEELKTKITTHFRGSKLDNLEGTVHLENTDFRYEKILYHINHVGLVSGKTAMGSSLELNSDNLDASVTGRYELAALGDAFRQILPQYLPALSVPAKPAAAKQDFAFNIRLKNMSVITENFFPSWSVGANTVIYGRFNNEANSSVTIESPSIRYQSMRVENSTFRCTTDPEKMSASFLAGSLFYSDSSAIALPQLHAEASRNKISFLLQLADSAIYPDRASMKGEVQFATDKKFDLHFFESAIVLRDVRWMLDPGNNIAFDSSVIRVNGFNFTNGEEKVSLAGLLSKNENDKLTIRIERLDLNHFNPLLSSSGMAIGGLLSGTATLSDVYRKVRLESDLNVEHIKVNGDTLGNATFVTTYDDGAKTISVNAAITSGSVNTVALKGDYHINSEKNNFDFDIRLNNLYLSTVSKYLEDILSISDLSGRASATLKLTGNFSRPAFSGKVNLNRVRCRVDYLNTNYNFTNDVIVEENYFELRDFKIYDEKGSYAVANGKITHRYFKDFGFQVNLAANKFECLNTSSSQNNIYYGTAFATGYANFIGPVNDLFIQIQFTSEKGSEIFLPLTSTSEIGQSSFISFREKGKFTEFSSLTNRVNLSGIRLDMNLEITPDAEISIIFDEKIGDVITGRGNGNLRLDINTIGDFNMYGHYEIEKGTYLFTLRNTFSKFFTIERGSTIYWDGNPYDANIELSAVHRVNTSSLYKLIADSSFRKSLNVDCELYLSNKLMNPTIRYGIHVRGLDAGTESQIQSMLNSEAEVSKQMFGLLVLNQFIPASNTSQASNRIDAGAGASSSGFEFLSDQFNNWLSQISPEVNIGVNYKTRDNYSKDELKVMLSKSLINDRLLIEGDLGLVGTTASSTDQSGSNVVGDFNAEYLLGPNGKFRIRAFNKSNTSTLVYNNAPYTQGVGIFYREEFNTFRELLEHYKLIRKKVPKKTDPPAPVK